MGAAEQIWPQYVSCQDSSSQSPRQKSVKNSKILEFSQSIAVYFWLQFEYVQHFRLFFLQAQVDKKNERFQ